MQLFQRMQNPGHYYYAEGEGESTPISQYMSCACQ